jgi:hypothetical protein
MSSSGIPVKLQPRTVPCHAVTAWYAESSLRVRSFEYGAGPPRAPATVAERIDAALGISATAPRALLRRCRGDLARRESTAFDRATHRAQPMEALVALSEDAS